MDLNSLISKISRFTDTSTLYTAISSAFTLTPSSSPLFPLFTLPSLLHRDELYNPYSGAALSGQLGLLKKSLALAIGSAGGSLFTTWGILPSGIETLLFQGVVSTSVALFIILILWLHTTVADLLDVNEDWISSPLFGLIWAGLWLLWTKLSPLGRLGIPTADDLDIYHRVLPCIGPVGLDFLVGATGHAISQTFEHSRAKTGEEVYRLERFHRCSSSYGSSGKTSRTMHSDVDTDSEPSRSSRSDIPLRPARPRRSSHRPSSFSVSSSQEELEDLEGSRWKGPRKLLGGLTGLLGTLTLLPAPTAMPLGGPISGTTSLSVACVFPSRLQATVNETILALRQVGNRAQLLVLPETAMVLDGDQPRENVIAQVKHDVCDQYGAYVALSMESPRVRPGLENEVVLVGPHGVIGSYVKRKLVPSGSMADVQQERRIHRLGLLISPSHFATFRFRSGSVIADGNPRGVTKPEWSSTPPFVRPVAFSPLICLDALHPYLVPLAPPPSFLVIPATSQPAVANQVIRHAEVLSSTRGIPSIVCSRGASAAIDETGQIKHRQDAGKGFIATMAIPWYGVGETRELTWAEAFGPTGVLAALGVASLSAKAAELWRHDGTGGLLKGVEAGSNGLKQGARKIKRLLTWRGEDRVAGSRAEGQPLLDEDEDSGRAPFFPALWPKIRITDLMSAA